MEVIIYNAILLGLFTIFTGAGGLSDVVLRVPTAVLSGSTATLLCLYDLEGDELYTVKWYKGKQEFFRYVPKELPHTRVFALPGINVDVVASGTKAVVLRDVKRSLTGKYSCEVSTDAPHFLTAIVRGYMHVVDSLTNSTTVFPRLVQIKKLVLQTLSRSASSPISTEPASMVTINDELEEKPEIQLEKNSYSIGDTLRGNCSSPFSSPPANVTWYINGETEGQSWINVNVNDSGAVTTSSLALDLTSNSFPGGKLHLRCVAELFSITRTWREVWLDEDRPRLASVLGSRGDAAHSLPSLIPQIVMVITHHYCCR